MSATSLKPVIEKLESLFSSFNQKFYNGELQTPVITVSPDTTKGAYGWCTSWKAWSNLDPDSKTTDISQMSKADLDAMQNEGFYEINITILCLMCPPIWDCLRWTHRPWTR